MSESPDPVRAAGGVVWRRDADAMRFLLVHRPRYDDWSFPKGKAETGEDELATALREVQEETGQRCRPGPRITIADYRVDDRPKQVAYYLLAAEGGSFAPGPEVDAVVWLTAERARTRLSYEKDRQVLDAALALLAGEAGR